MLGLTQKTAKVTFVNEVPADLTASCDGDQMARVLLNLMRNSTQALTRAGSNEGETPRLWVGGHLHHGTVVLQIRDNGPGVPERAKANLFRAFRGSATPGGDGFGAGDRRRTRQTAWRDNRARAVRKRGGVQDLPAAGR